MGQQKSLRDCHGFSGFQYSTRTNKIKAVQQASALLEGYLHILRHPSLPFDPHTVILGANESSCHPLSMTPHDLGVNHKSSGPNCKVKR